MSAEPDADLVKQGRNRPCRCGSGRKAKRCCGAEVAPLRKDARPNWDGESFRDFQLMLDRRARNSVVHSEAFLQRRMAGQRLHQMRLWPASRHQAFEVLFDYVYDGKPVPRESGQPVWKKVAQAATSSIYDDRALGPGSRKRARKRASWHRPDKDEQHVREIARLWRAERLARKDDGDISGLLAVAAELAAADLQRHAVIAPDDESLRSTTDYVYGVWGDLLGYYDHSKTPSEMLAGLPSHDEWRERSVRGRAS